MFISRIEIPWDDVRNPYDVHRRVWKLFPGEDKEARTGWEDERQGFLFRTESYGAGQPARLLVQSRRAPQAVPCIALLGCRDVDPRPEAGQRLAFVVTANPVKTIDDARKDDKPGKRSAKVRVPLVKEPEQREWLSRKLAAAAGVEDVSILPLAPIYFRKGNRAGKVVPVTFEGVLRVEDGDLLREILIRGLGPAKAFGCGLLLVRRLG